MVPFSVDHLGCGVEGRTAKGVQQAFRTEIVTKTKINEFDRLGLTEEHILWFEITVNDRVLLYL